MDRSLDALAIWRDEFEVTREWGGVATLVMHPQVTGRPMRMRILEQFLAFVRGFDDVWWATGRDICQWVEAAEATGDRRSEATDSVAG